MELKDATPFFLLGSHTLHVRDSQFLDHDIDLTEPDAEAGTAPIVCPQGDLLCASGEMAFTRSEYVIEGGSRQQMNLITSLIDGSVVYGSDDVRALALRTRQGGKLKTTPLPGGHLLPFNLEGLPNAPDTNSNLFLAGDIRANEQLGLTAMVSFVSLHDLPIRSSYMAHDVVCVLNA